MESLLAEKKKREQEVEVLRSSEPKIRKELEALTDTMARMKADSKTMSDSEGLKNEFERTKQRLNDMAEEYRTRRVAIQQQVRNRLHSRPC